MANQEDCKHERRHLFTGQCRDCGKEFFWHISELAEWKDPTDIEGFDKLFEKVETCLVCCGTYAKGLMCPTCFKGG